MRLSMNKVNETGFFMHFVFLLLISVIPILLLNFLSAMIPLLFVLKILLPPFQAGCLASLYVDQFGRVEPAVLHGETEEPVAPTAEASAQQAEDTVKGEAEINVDKAAEDETPAESSSQDEMPNRSHENNAGQEKM
jgi:hypothetical protein